MRKVNEARATNPALAPAGSVGVEALNNKQREGV